MQIVDVHSHLGWDQVFEREFGREELVASHFDNGVSTTIVQPACAVDLPSARERHDVVASLVRQHPGHFVGMANANPRGGDAEYFAEVERCVRHLGFVGVKMHTLAHAVAPGSLAGHRVFEAAKTLGVPVMVHTGTGLPFGAPSLIGPVARQYPDVKVVVAHSGMQLLVLEALALAQMCDNVWLETTWISGHWVRTLVRTIGASRVLFGSDEAYNLQVELCKHRAIGLSDKEMEWVLGGTATAVYNLRPLPPETAR